MTIKSAKYLISSPNVANCPAPDRPEYAFIGRSNVGKSSLINLLCNVKNLAKTSSSPGKTQMINHFAIHTGGKSQLSDWYLVDLPGYGYAKTAIKNRRTWGQMIENYIRKRENLINLFVLIDSRHQPQKIDLEFLESLAKWEVPFSIVFTKSDKEKPAVVERNVKTFLDTMRESWYFLPASFVTSAEKKIGRDEVLNYIERLNMEATEKE
ncbi:MAG: ribosome biogenesis GTP-binding protein YihA/YsxC [Chitinophagaceae bacterium]